MPTQVQFRRGNTSQVQAFTGAAGEIVVDSTKNTLVVQNGTNPGGTPLAPNSAYDVANSSFGVANSSFAAANSAFLNTVLYSLAF